MGSHVTQTFFMNRNNLMWWVEFYSPKSVFSLAIIQYYQYIIYTNSGKMTIRTVSCYDEMKK